MPDLVIGIHSSYSIRHRLRSVIGITHRLGILSGDLVCKTFEGKNLDLERTIRGQSPRRSGAVTTIIIKKESASDVDDMLPLHHKTWCPSAKTGNSFRAGAKVLLGFEPRSSSI